MSDDAPTPAGLPPRSDAFRRFMAAPVIFALVMMIAVGALFLLAVRGGTATGDRVAIAFDTCDAAGPILLARAEAIGLGSPALDGATLTATLPGLDDDATAVPALLAAPGALEIRREGEVLATHEDVTVALVRLDESGLPYTWIELEEAALAAVTAAVLDEPDGNLLIALDGVVVADRPNSREVADGGLRIVEAREMTSKERMRRSVDRAILLSHGPLPCPTTVRAVTPLAAAGSDG